MLNLGGYQDVMTELKSNPPSIYFVANCNFFSIYEISTQYRTKMIVQNRFVLRYIEVFDCYVKTFITKQ